MKPRLIIAFVPPLLALMMACITVQTVTPKVPAAPTAALQQPSNTPLPPTTVTPVPPPTDTPQLIATAIPVSQPQYTQRWGRPERRNNFPCPFSRPSFLQMQLHP